jgi:hypothetical protein
MVRRVAGSPRIIEMSKPHLIPVFAVALAALACGSTSDRAKTGTGGSGGADAGSSGAGGTANAASSCPDDAGIQPPACTTDVMSPSAFCTLLLAFCCPTKAGYTTMNECLSTYSSLATADPSKQMCESYHLCNAANDTGSDRKLHCGHAVGEDLCAF